MAEGGWRAVGGGGGSNNNTHIKRGRGGGGGVILFYKCIIFCRHQQLPVVINRKGIGIAFIFHTEWEPRS